MAETVRLPIVKAFLRVSNWAVKLGSEQKAGGGALCPEEGPDGFVQTTGGGHQKLPVCADGPSPDCDGKKASDGEG